MAGRFSVEAIFRAVDRVTGPVARMQRTVRRFTQSAVNNLNKVSRATNEVARGFFTVGKNATFAGSAAATAGSILFTRINQSTTEVEALSAAMKVNADSVKAIAKEIEPIGLGFENVTDLVEEMTNKLGESAGLEEITPVTEALDILGLKFADLEKLSPDQQFNKLTDAMIKHTDATQAAAAADILFGGEANKIISVLQRQGKTVDQLTKEYKQLNFLTDEGKKGAADFTDTWADLSQIIGSVIQQFAGLLGGIIAPLLKRLTEWAKANRALIATKIEEWVKKTVKFFIELWNAAKKVFEFFKEHHDTIAKVAMTIGVLIVALKALAAIMVVVNAVMFANPIGLIILGIAALIAVIATAIIWWDDLKAAFLGLPGPVKAAIALVAGPIGWLIGAAALIMDNWEPIKGFFADMFESIGELWDGLKATIVNFFDSIIKEWENFTGFVSSLNPFGSDDNTEETATDVGLRREIPIGMAASAGVINGGRDDKLEVTINNNTDTQATVSKSKLSAGGSLNMKQSGAFAQ